MVNLMHRLTNQNKKMLFYYCNTNKKAPSADVVYKDANIGRWLDHKKYKIITGSMEIYESLSENKYVKDYIDLFLLNKKKKKLSFDEYKELLFKYCDEFKCVPKRGIVYGGYNLENWLHNRKNMIDDKESDIYKELSKNKYVKENLDLLFDVKETNKDKVKLTFDEWKKILFEYCDKFKTHPPMGTKYNNVGIGNWFQKRKSAMSDLQDEVYIPIPSFIWNVLWLAFCLQKLTIKISK